MIEKDITAYILAGGRSRRMGVDKLFLRIEGRSLLERTIEACKASFDTVKLVSRPSDKLSSLGLPMVTDSPRAGGPMAGVIAALEDCEDDRCFITAADLFDLGSPIIESIISRYADEQYLGLREAGGIQPLCGIYHTSSLEVFYRMADGGEYSMTKAVRELAHSAIALPEGRWRNINRPGDLAIGGLDG